MVNARKAIESLYTGTCSIEEYQEVKDATTKITKHSPQVVLSNQPCKLSFETIVTNSETSTGAEVRQTAKLFIAPEILIKPGSKITVSQNGVTTEYKNTGEPAFYTSHQEVMLELFKGWA